MFVYKNGEKHIRLCESIHTTLNFEMLATVDIHEAEVFENTVDQCKCTKPELCENPVKNGYP